MRRRILPLIAVAVLTVLTVLAALPVRASVAAADTAKYIDMPNDWSTVALEKAIDNGLLKGFVIGGKNYLKPADNLTRAQMATIVNRAFGAVSEAALPGVTDVVGDVWFVPEMKKAVMMGTMKLDTRMRPDDNITREEAFTILGRALKLNTAGSDFSPLYRFGDGELVSAWAKGTLAAMAKGGYIQGSGGVLHPQAHITRAEMAQVMYNIIKQYVNQAGTVKSVVTDGNVMVNVAGVTLENLTVHGDLLIGDGVADGDITLHNVTVTGRTVVRGGGGDSVYISGNSRLGMMVIWKIDGEIRIETADDAGIDAVYIEDGCDDVILTGVFDEIVLGGGIRASAADAKIERAVIEGKDSALSVADGSIVARAVVSAGAENARIQGGGFVLAAEVKADGAAIETVGTQVRVDYGINGTKAGGVAISGGAKVTVKPGQAAALDTEAPVLGEIAPRSGEQNLTGSQTLRLTVDAADNAALLELEIQHNIGGLPKLVFAASKANPYGFGEAKKQIIAAGITVAFNQDSWTVDFGAALTEQMKASQEEVTLLFTVKDTAGLLSAAGDNTRRYTVSEKYTVTFKAGPGGSLEAGDQQVFSSIPKGTAWGSAVTVPRHITHNGRVFIGWQPLFPATVTESATYTAQFVLIPYLLTYEGLSGTTIAPNPSSYTIETSSFTLNNPSKNGYSFAGWTGPGLSDVTPVVTVRTGSTGDRTYTAHFTKNTYWIIYTLNGGVPVGANPATYDVESWSFLLANPSKTGYEFAGWTGTGLAEKTVNVSVPTGSYGNRSYEAHYTPISYPITYNGLAGAVISGNPASYTIESASFTLPQPTKGGYTFTGWTGTGLSSQTLAVTVPKGSMEPRSYTAHFAKNTYGISYDLAGGAVSGTNSVTYDVESESFTLSNPSKTGYTFTGWTGTGLSEQTVNVTVPTGSYGDRDYTAHYTPISYPITYNGLEGAVISGHPASYTVESASFTLPQPTKGGYTFTGWTGTGLSSQTLAVTVLQGSTGDRSYTAHFTKDTYDIAYDLAGGTVETDNPLTYDVESESFTLSNPSKTGYDFTGWSGTGLSEQTVNVTVPTGSYGDRDYTAHYTPISYGITYGGLEGAVISGNPASYTIESASFTLPQPTKGGYTFTGWTGTGLSSQTLAVTVLQGSTGDRSYTAHFTKDTYGIIYTLNDGVPGGANPATYDVESWPFLLANPSKTGYDFAGWTGTGLTEKTVNVIVPAGSFGNRSYEAHYTPISYPITYNGLAGAVISGHPASYTIESESFTLPQPTKEGYTFTGWTGTGLSSQTLAVTVLQGSTGDRSYTAHFADTSPPAEVTVNPVKDSALTLHGDESFVLTVSARDNAGLYELEIDHNMTGSPYNLPEFSVYADKGNPYGSPEDEALFEETYGVLVTYEENDGEGAWTIDFGAAITERLIEKGSPVFYLVLKDQAGNAWGSMDPVTEANTFRYTLGLT